MSDVRTVQLNIVGMGCASCVGRVEAALREVPGVEDAPVNFASETAQVTFAGPMLDIAKALDTAGYPAATRQVELRIDGMSCASCVSKIERALESAAGVVAAQVNLATEGATVTYLEGSTSPEALSQVPTGLGYPARPSSIQGNEATPDAKTEEIQKLTHTTIVAAVLALPVIILEMGGHMIPAFHHWVHATLGAQTSQLIQFALTSGLLIGPGRVFYLKGIPSLIRAAPDMNALVALGTGAAYLYSVTATFAPQVLPQGTANVYFEAAAVIVVLILLGRLLEARAKGKTGAAIRKLVGLQPKTARVEQNGTTVDRPIAEITVVDILQIRPGERVPVDAEVLDGTSYVDESMITGEPVPVGKSAKDQVVGGTVNGAGALRVRSSRVGADTVLAQVIRMVEQAQGATPLFMAIDGQAAASLTVSDPIKPGTPEALAQLHEMGLTLAMVTGDNARTAQALADRLGIDHITAEVLPDGKLSAINALRNQYGTLAFVGDGINDAPALAAADKGIAIGTGTDVAIETADVVLMSGDLRGVTNAMEMSRRTMRNIRQNLGWAFGYNILLIPVAAGVLYPFGGHL